MSGYDNHHTSRIKPDGVRIIGIGKFILPYVGFTIYEPQNGDVLFQPLPRQSDLVRAIEGITHSPFSHCGVVIHKDEQWYVIEALGHVKTTPLQKWIRQGRYGRFAAYRLKSQYRSIIPKFIEALHAYLGLPYDGKYKMDDEAIYCSELVFKGFLDATNEELGKLARLKELDWEPYKEIIEKYDRGSPPLDRIMITPKHLTEARQLQKVFGFCL